MRVVLADVEEATLQSTATALASLGASVLAVPTDVSQADAIDNLAQTTLDHFGAVHLVCNNAGVITSGTPIWENTLADWKWSFGVNLWGVIHGIRTFIPIMLKQNTPCHLVNTASAAALNAGPGLGIYAATKHSVVSISETLYYELAEQSAQVHVSVLCPAFVKTRIMDAARNRPPIYQDSPEQLPPIDQTAVQAMVQYVEHGSAPEQIADAVFAAIQREQLYIPLLSNWGIMGAA